MVLPTSPVADFIAKQNDTSAPFKGTCYSQTSPTATPTVVDITGASLEFHMRPLAEGSALKVSAAAVITDAANGEWEYRWAAGDLDLSDYSGQTEGHYIAEVQVTFADGTIRTFPNRGESHIIVRRELG